MKNRGLYLGIGFLIWLLATIVFRVAGHLFFLTENAIVVAGLYIATGIALFIVAQVIFRWQSLNNSQQIEASALLVLPGMIADAIVILFFTQVFPNMPLQADGTFGAWLLWAYASVLIAGFVTRNTST